MYCEIFTLQSHVLVLLNSSLETCGIKLCLSLLLSRPYILSYSRAIDCCNRLGLLYKSAEKTLLRAIRIRTR